MADPNNEYYGHRVGNQSAGYGMTAADSWNKRLTNAVNGSGAWDASNISRFGTQQQYSTRSRDDFADNQRRGDYSSQQPYGGQQRQQYGDHYDALQKLRDEIQQLQSGFAARAALHQHFEESNQTLERRLIAVEDRQRDAAHDINRRLEKLEKVVEDMVQEIRRAATVPAGIPHLQPQPISSTMYGISPDVVLRARQHQQPLMHPLTYGAPMAFGGSLGHHHPAGPPPPARGPPRHDLSSNWSSSSVHRRLGPAMRPPGTRENTQEGNNRHFRTSRQNGVEGGRASKMSGRPLATAAGRGKQSLNTSSTSATTSKEKSGDASASGQVTANKRARPRRLRNKGNKKPVQGGANTAAATPTTSPVKVGESSGGSQLSNETSEGQQSGSQAVPSEVAENGPVPMETQPSSQSGPQTVPDAAVLHDFSATNSGIAATEQ